MKNILYTLEKVNTNSKIKFTVKAPRPFTRKPIKPRQAHKLATRYTRKIKHNGGLNGIFT